MLNAIVRFSLRFRGVVIALACALAAYGLYVTTRAKLDVFPDFLPPQVVIQAEAPGLSAEEVEQLVTRPVENAINGVGSLDALRSQSIQGLSVITVIFRDGTDIYRARQLIAERLAEISGKLPSGLPPPRMSPLTSSTSMVLAFGLTSTNRSLMDLRTFADAVLQPRLLGVSGVAKISNTMEVTKQVERALDELKPELAAQNITLHERLFCPANFIETAIRNVRFSLLLGGVLVAVVLFLFLANFRTAAISFTAIPLSLLGAVIVLDKLGVALNTLTLGGLAIAIGEVVDDAIIDVENILRRLRENAASAAPKAVFQVVLDASLEVRTAVVYATFVVVLVFVPVLAMGGIQGKLFSPLGLAYILAIMFSLVVALTLTPAMAFAFFHKKLPSRGEPRYMLKLKSGYRNLLARIMAYPRRVIAVVTVMSLLAVAALPFFGGAFLPELRSSAV